MVAVTVHSAGRVPLAKGLPLTVTLDRGVEEATIGDVKAAVAAKYPKFYVERQKLSLKGEKKALADESTLKDAGVQDGDELAVKDLGPQISWKTVFVVEYLGPLLIHPLFYHFPRVFYGGSVIHSTLQKYVYTMVMLHFAKRELETLFVHRFSHGTMPAFNIFKNSGHYWLLSGLLMAYSIYSPTYDALSPWIRGRTRNDPNFLWVGTGLWLFAELSNLHTHITVRNLRPAGTKKRAIPNGYGFALVSFPNYFFEILSWTIVAGMTGSWAAWLFVGVSGYTMTIWALKKHKAYRKEFGQEYPKSRKAIFPLIL